MKLFNIINIVESMAENSKKIEHKLRAKLILIYLILFGCKTIYGDNHKSAVFHFPEYAYKDTNKNVLVYRELEASCETSKTCEPLEGVNKINCVRQCISQTCYQDIYEFDDLEEGEIDVRFNSFKGCVIQRSIKSNRL